MPNLGKLIEEVCFLIKVEEKTAIMQLGIDNLVLALHLAADKDKINAKIEKELDYRLDDEDSKITQAYDCLIQRLDQGLLPFVNEQNRVEFCPWQSLEEERKQPAA